MTCKEGEVPVDKPKGARFVHISEPEPETKNNTMNISVVKKLVGNDFISVGHENKEPIPQNKMPVSCGAIPPIREDDHLQVRRRIRVVPFESRFVDRDEGVEGNERVRDEDLDFLRTSIKQYKQNK